MAELPEKARAVGVVQGQHRLGIDQDRNNLNNFKTPIVMKSAVNFWEEVVLWSTNNRRSNIHRFREWEVLTV